MTQERTINEAERAMLERLYTEYHDELVRFAERHMGRHLRREYDPDEIIQEVFVNFVASPREFESVNSLEAYLKNAVRNKINQFVTRQKALKRDVRRQVTGETILDHIKMMLTGRFSKWLGRQ